MHYAPESSREIPMWIYYTLQTKVTLILETQILQTWHALHQVRARELEGKKLSCQQKEGSNHFTFAYTAV